MIEGAAIAASSSSGHRRNRGAPNSESDTVDKRRVIFSFNLTIPRKLTIACCKSKDAFPTPIFFNPRANFTNSGTVLNTIFSPRGTAHSLLAGRGAPVQLEEPTIATNLVVDAGTAKTVPHHGLVGADDGFARGVFDVLQHVECANAATTDENGLGTNPVDAEREVF